MWHELNSTFQYICIYTDLGAQLLWGLAGQPPILGMTLRHCEGAGHQRLAMLPWRCGGLCRLGGSGVTRVEAHHAANLLVRRSVTRAISRSIYKRNTKIIYLLNTTVLNMTKHWKANLLYSTSTLKFTEWPWTLIFDPKLESCQNWNFYLYRPRSVR